jgi:hypothetical protein
MFADLKLGDKFNFGGMMDADGYKQINANFHPSQDFPVEGNIDNEKKWGVAAQAALTDKLRANARLDSYKNWSAAIDYAKTKNLDFSAGVRGGEGRKPYFNAGMEYRF